MVVLFPAPLGPRKEKISPFRTLKLMPRTALKSLNACSRPLTSMISASPIGPVHPGLVHPLWMVLSYLPFPARMGRAVGRGSAPGRGGRDNLLSLRGHPARDVAVGYGQGPNPACGVPAPSRTGVVEAASIVRAPGIIPSQSPARRMQNPKISPDMADVAERTASTAAFVTGPSLSGV